MKYDRTVSEANPTCLSFVSLLLSYVYSTYSQNAVAKGTLAGLPPRRLRLVLQYIHAHLRERLMVRDLAKLVQMSPQHFGNLFRQSTGYSAYSYILHHRIEQGKRLLAETKLPIMEIALEVGFAHHSHFGDTFRQLTGIAPKQYRRQFENISPE